MESAIQSLIDTFLPTALVLGGVWWLLQEGWPYWKSRDTLERERESKVRDREVAAQQALADALQSVAMALDSFPNSPGGK